MQVVRRATHGALLHCDCLAAPSWQSDPWAQWLAWQTGRWLKSLGIIRPLYCERLLFHEDSVIEQARHAAPCPLTADLGSAAPLTRRLYLVDSVIRADAHIRAARACKQTVGNADACVHAGCEGRVCRHGCAGASPGWP